MDKQTTMHQLVQYSQASPDWTYYLWYRPTTRTWAITARLSESSMPREGNRPWKIQSWAQGGQVVHI